MTLQNRQHVIDNAYTLLEVHRQRQGILAQTYLWIVLYHNCYGWMPTQDEIGRRFNVSGEAVFKRVNRLVSLGFLRMPFGKHRGIELVEADSRKR